MENETKNVYAVLKSRIPCDECRGYQATTVTIVFLTKFAAESHVEFLETEEKVKEGEFLFELEKVKKEIEFEEVTKLVDRQEKKRIEFSIRQKIAERLGGPVYPESVYNKTYYKVVKVPLEEKGARPCTCGSNEPWAYCHANSPFCG